MKWIGQNIYDLIARFRNDVYLEDISAGTIASGGNLGLDSNNKIVKQSDTGITDLHGAGVDGSNNQLLTDDGDGTVTSEANLTFNGTTLACAGNQTSNTTADVLNITADSVTTANVIDISCDALTTGSALKIEDDSSVTGVGGARNIVDIYQKNTAADVAIPLYVKSDGAQTAVIIDKNASGTGGQNAKGLSVDLDRTVPGSGTAAHNDVGINVAVDSASLGTSSLKGLYVDVNGATSGTSTAYGVDIDVSGADTNYGIQIKSANAQLRLVAAADNDDIGTITVADTGDMTIQTIGDGTTDSDLTLDADGDIKLEPATGKSILLDGTIDIDAGVVTGATSITSTSFVGALTGQADTVATIAGLAPNTATTQATQGNITTCSSLVSIGTITTGVWNGTAIASAYLDSDTAHLSGTQTFTGAKTFTDTVALTGTGRITGVDTVSADTDAASKVYADRPAKQIQIYHANWKGAAGTGLTYIPLAGVPDETIGSGGSVGAKESNAIIMPAAGKIKEIILRQHWTSTITTSDDITWTVYNRASNKKVNAFTAIGSTFDMVNPTQGGTDANNTRTSGEISYDFAEYDAVVISMQWASTGPTNNADRHFVTVVVEYDYTGIGY